jgi:hypothetical protein
MPLQQHSIWLNSGLVRRKPSEPDTVLWASCSKRVTNTTCAFIFLFINFNYVGLCSANDEDLQYIFIITHVTNHFMDSRTIILPAESSSMIDVLSVEICHGIQILFCFWTLKLGSSHSSLILFLFFFLLWEIVILIKRMLSWKN